MIALESQNSICLVGKIEKLKLHDEFVIRMNNETIYKSFEKKEDAELQFNELCKYLKMDKLIILKRDED